MSGATKKLLAIGVAMLAFAGAGAALAGGGLGFGDDKQAFLDDVAKRLGVTPEKLRQAFQGAYGDRLDAAVASGKITQAQADELKQRLQESGGLPFFGGHRGFGGDRGFGHHGRAPFAIIGTASKYLGLTERELRSELGSGKTLAEVAKAQGKTAAGLKQALTDATKKDLDAAVAAGRLTQAQADARLEGLDARLDVLIDGKAGRGLGRHFGGHFGDMRPGGSAPQPAFRAVAMPVV